MKKLNILIFLLFLNGILANTQDIQVSLDIENKEGFIADETLIGTLTILNASDKEIIIYTQGMKAEIDSLPNPYWIYTKENFFKIPANETKEIEVFILIPQGDYEGKTYNGALEIEGRFLNGNIALATGFKEIKFTVKKERFTIEEFNQLKQEDIQSKSEIEDLKEKNAKLKNYFFITGIVLFIIIGILLIELWRHRKAYKETNE